MLESIGSSNVSNYNTRLTTNGERNNGHSMAVAVPADAIAIDCSYGSGNGNSTDGTKSAGGNQFITVSPEFEYLPDLELGPPSSEIAVDNNPANVPGSETVVQMSPIPELASDVQMRAATEQAATHSDDPSSVSASQAHFASSVIPNVESSDKDKEGIETNVASMDDVQTEAEQSTTPVAAETKDENTDGDTRGPKKGKRKKNKGKGKSK
ncbi:hypothetical protein EV175_006689 [Coemansia sp. RSA 1933]|nr:hypothetical protein EV175_006689 [Coemansia sp. RSA 1933]